MKKLSFLIFTIVSCGFLTANVSASALSGASCTVTARVVDVGSKAPGNDRAEYNPTYLKLEVLQTKRVGLIGDCSFVAIGTVFKITSGTDLVSLNVRDTIEAGVELTDSMGPSGVVPFILWKPISLVSLGRTLPSAFELQSGDKPEGSITESEIASDVDTNDKGAMPVTEDDITNSTVPIIELVSILILVGSLIYYYSRQRKT